MQVYATGSAACSIPLFAGARFAKRKEKADETKGELDLFYNGRHLIVDDAGENDATQLKDIETLLRKALRATVNRLNGESESAPLTREDAETILDQSEQFYESLYQKALRAKVSKTFADLVRFRLW